MESMNGPRARVGLRRTLFFGLTFLTAGWGDRADAGCAAGERT